MRNYKISRRNFLAVAGTLTAAAALTACGGSASSTVASSTASSSVASDSTPAAASGTSKVTVYSLLRLVWPISWPRALRQRLVSR